MSKSTAILVLGMPRSGTSAVTRVLNLHGAELSENLLPASKPNPKGFFESADALAIHERLLESMGRSWFDIREMPEGWLEYPETLQAQKELTELLRRDYFDKPLWVIKEPRMCRIVPLWLRVLKSLDISPRVVLVSRHPEEVVSSVAKMVGEDCWGPEHTELLWLEYFFEAEKATRALPRALITYDQLLDDWELSFGRLASELKLDWPISSHAAKSKIESYLGTDCRHYHYKIKENNISDRPSFTERVYSICNEMNGDYWSALLSIQSEFASAFSLFHPPMQDLVVKAAHHADSIILKQQAELNNLRQHHNDVFFAQQTEISSLKLTLEEMTERSASSGCEVAKLSSMIDEVSDALAVSSAREMELKVALLDAQSSYSALLALTGSRKWLVNKFFAISKK